jgi:flagellar basal body rod protein FlgG
MIQGVCQSAAAADVLQTWNDVIARNLAGGTMPGFENGDVSFEGVAARVFAVGSSDEQATISPQPLGVVGFSAGSMQRTNDPTEFAISGDVTIHSADGATTYTVQLVRFANAAGLESLGGNLFAETPASGNPETGTPGENGFGGLRQGYLESSNVDVVSEMVRVILAQRAYEINSKSIQTIDDMLQRVSQLKRYAMFR